MLFFLPFLFPLWGMESTESLGWRVEGEPMLFDRKENLLEVVLPEGGRVQMEGRILLSGGRTTVLFPTQGDAPPTLHAVGGIVLDDEESHIEAGDIDLTEETVILNPGKSGVRAEILGYRFSCHCLMELSVAEGSFLLHEDQMGGRSEIRGEGVIVRATTMGGDLERGRLWGRGDVEMNLTWGEGEEYGATGSAFEKDGDFLHIEEGTLLFGEGGVLTADLLTLDGVTGSIEATGKFHLAWPSEGGL